MNRSVRDLRELICVSRLTCRESDDEDERGNGYGLTSETISASGASTSDSSRASSANSLHLQTCTSPASDSGIVTSTDSNPDSLAIADTSKQQTVNVIAEKLQNNTTGKKNRKKVKRPNTNTVSQQVTVRPDIRKKFTPLPPVSDKKQTPNVGSNWHADGDNVKDLLGNMLESADMDIISDWLKQANAGVTNISLWCSTGDNFVRFAHFWLSLFSEQDQRDIFTLEYNLLLDQLTFVFDSSKCKFSKENLMQFLTIVLREYPNKLLSAKGSYLFLQYLETLCERRENFRQLLSDVRYSTTVKEHIQCILAVRSYAIISIWEAVIKFFQKLSLSPDFPLQSSASKTFADVKNPDSQLAVRIEQAISLGYIDVIQYYLETNQVPADFKASHKRTLIFMSVVHSQPAVLAFLLLQSKIAATINVPSDSGNTALHAAANAGDVQLVSMLLSVAGVNVNITNKQCDNATPLHIAVMHGHTAVVKVLLTAGADIKAPMGQMSVAEIAETFEHLDMADLLKQSR